MEPKAIHDDLVLATALASWLVVDQEPNAENAGSVD
jgi:hypothetical protein